MGRHSKGDQGPFYRSLLGWFVPWLLVAAVVGVAIWFLVDAIGGEEVASSSGDRTPTASPSPTAAPSPTETAIVLASPKPTSSPASKPKPEKSQDPKDVALITEGINIQVLNGTTDTAADDALADTLTGLGFTVEAIEDSSKAYPRTTVFWSYPEAQEAAEALAARMGWLAQPKPENLSDTVALHVVVGTDEV